MLMDVELETGVIGVGWVYIPIHNLDSFERDKQLSSPRPLLPPLLTPTDRPQPLPKPPPPLLALGIQWPAREGLRGRCASTHSPCFPGVTQTGGFAFRVQTRLPRVPNSHSHWSV